MALLPQPHGITSHLLVGKTLDGHARCSVALLLHMYIATCNLFNESQRQQQCQMYELVWRCREIMTWPLHRCRLDETQALLNDMDKNLIKYMLPFSKSGCRSEKHHQWAHYCHHRCNTGCTAKEYAFERSYAVGHKKQVQFTNKSATKTLQTSAKHWFRNGVHRLAVHLNLVEREEESAPVIRTQHLEKPGRHADFKWPSETIRRILERKAEGMVPPMQPRTASTSLHVTLKNRLALRGKADRLVPVLLRANHSGPLRWVDNIRVQYREDYDNAPAVGFAKCLGFVGCDRGDNYVAIQWYKICGRSPVQRVSRMTRVELIESYQYVPAGSILNGALIVPIATAPEPGFPQQHWVVQSHREGTSLDRLNGHPL